VCGGDGGQFADDCSSDDHTGIGTPSFELPLDTSATTHAFNSLGEDVFDGNSGVGMDLSAIAAAFAAGTARRWPRLW
jgi:hypothetical protein